MGGLPARLFRISFSGELAYEIAVPAGYGDALIRRIMEAGQEFGIAPYGTEALGVMRIEKGHVAGNEINGQTTARDLGLGRMLSARKDYIGRVMAQRPGMLAADRPTLVGFKPVDRAERLRAGAHFIPEGAQPVAANDQGYMTSVAFSPTLGHWIGLGLLAHGPRAMASACAPTIPCAAATCWSRCAIPSSTILPESACVAETANLIVSALDGVVTAGRYGRRTGDAGVIVSEVRGAGLATVTARKGQRARPRRRGAVRLRRRAARPAAPGGGA